MYPSSLPKLLLVWAGMLYIACPADSTFAQRQVYPHEYTQEQLRNFFAQTIRQYTFESDEPLDLQLHAEPILNETNPARKSLRGSIFVWTEAGRPAVIVKLFTFDQSGGFMYRHQTNSVIEKPLRALLNGREVWTPRAARMAWHDFESQPPEETAPRRLIQIRSLARRFRADKTELDGNLVNLHLMPQPLFRYSSPKNNIIDGAILGLSEATAPTIVLMIEAYQPEQGPAKFRWAAYQSHFIVLNLYLDDEKVWSVPQNRQIAMTLEGQKPYSNEPYFAFFSRDAIPPPDELTETQSK